MMAKPDPPPSAPHFAQRTVAAFVEALASDAVAPGSGAAAAVALALAAGCAAKAAAVTLKHRPGDQRLTELHDRLRVFAGHALTGADRDAQRFEAFQKQKSAATAAPLLRSGEQLQHSAADLQRWLDELAGQVSAVVHGDVLAARALCTACVTIHSENLKENQRASAALPLSGL